MRGKRILAALLCAAMAVSLGACGGGSAPSSSAAESGSSSAPSAAESSAPSTATESSSAAEAAPAAAGGTVNYYMQADPDTFDPGRADDENKNAIVGEVQETLIRLKNGEVTPAGAESWETSEDGLTWTFHLRDNKYHDGTPVKAEDYVNSIRRIFDPEVNCHNAGIFYCIKGGEEFNTGTGTKEDVGVAAPDDKTLVFTLVKPLPYFLQLMLFNNVTPVPPALTEGANNASYGADVSVMKFSGPFYIEKWTRGSDVILKKNPNYWDAETVKLDGINGYLVLEEQTREQMFEQGEIDILRNVRSEFAEKLQPRVDGGEFTLDEGPQPRASYICFNNKDPEKVFTNVKVRKAFSAAIDRETFVTNVQKKERAAYGWIPYGLNNGDVIFRDVVPEPLSKGFVADPKALLIEGLNELGLGAPENITVTFLQANANNDTKVKAEFYQNQWQTKLGVTVKIDTMPDNSTFNNTVSKGNYQVCQTGWGGDYNDPMTFMQCFVTDDGNNPAFFSNAKYDELIIACQTEADMNVRQQKFAEAEKILCDTDAGIGPLTFAFNKNVINNRLKGAIINGAGGPAVEFKWATVEG